LLDPGSALAFGDQRWVRHARCDRARRAAKREREGPRGGAGLFRGSSGIRGGRARSSGRHEQSFGLPDPCVGRFRGCRSQGLAPPPGY
jgi:hypothetical protein